MCSLALTNILEPGAEKPNSVRGQTGKANVQNILGEVCVKPKSSCPFHSGLQQLSAPADWCHQGVGSALKTRNFYLKLQTTSLKRKPNRKI